MKAKNNWENKKSIYVYLLPKFIFYYPINSDKKLSLIADKKQGAKQYIKSLNRFKERKMAVCSKTGLVHGILICYFYFLLADLK